MMSPNVQTLESEKKKFPDLSRQIVVFSFSQEEYGVPIQWVQEVLEHSWFTLIPGTGPVVRGGHKSSG